MLRAQSPARAIQAGRLPQATVERAADGRQPFPDRIAPRLCDPALPVDPSGVRLAVKRFWR